MTVVKANTFYAILPELSGEYLVRFVDDQNKKSSAVRSVIHTLTDAQPRLLILEDREDSDSPEFQGQKNDTFYSEEYDALVIDGNQTIDDILDITAYVWSVWPVCKIGIDCDLLKLIDKTTITTSQFITSR